MSNVQTPDEYIRNLDPARQEFVSTVRQTVLDNLDPGFEETVDFGMIAYCVPLERYPETYNGHPLMYAALASQKRYVSLYLMGLYADPEATQWFEDAYQKTGLKLNMGKSCVRFTRLENVPLELVGEAIGRYSVESFLDVCHRATSK
jgi:hypothetical protein